MTSLSTHAALPPSRHARMPDLVLIAITMVWGGTFLTVQNALQWTGPFGLVGMRFAVAGMIALLFCGKHLWQLSARELGTGVIIGTVLFVSYSLQTTGLQYISSSKSAFLTALYVPLVPLFQLLLFRHRPHMMAWVGIAIAFSGLILLSDPRGIELSFGLGEWLTVAGAAATALEISLISHFARGCSPRRVTVVQLLTVSILAAIGWQVSGEPVPQMHPILLLSLLGLGLATSAIQIAMNWAQKTVPATRATIIYALEPVWAGLVGALAGEQLTLLTICGAAMIVFSVLVSELGRIR